MPRLLVAVMLTLLLIGYYFYRGNDQDNAQNKIENNTTEIKKEKVINNTTVIQTEKIQKANKVQKTVKKTKPVSQKKKDFYAMMIPALDVVYKELQEQYIEIDALIKNNPTDAKIALLKKRYKVDSNEELLIALKPHPKSIAVAQGAMESAWGTSRFYKDAYNIFGVWSFNKNDKRIAAGETRGTKTIWLKKYDNVTGSIRDYYLTMSRSKAFKSFKKLNFIKENQDPYLLVKKLDRYSEKGALYGEELASMISYNNFTSYDEVQYKKPSKRVKLLEVVDAIQDNESSFGTILQDMKKEK